MSMKQAELATALGLSRGQISKLTAKGMPLDSVEAAEAWRRKNLEPAKVVAFQQMRKEPPASADSDADGYDLTDERARLAHHQANIAAIEEDTKRKVLIPAELVKSKWQDMIGAARARLLALPTRIAASCVGLDEVAMERAAREIVHQALDELARSDGVD